MAYVFIGLTLRPLRPASSASSEFKQKILSKDSFIQPTWYNVFLKNDRKKKKMKVIQKNGTTISEPTIGLKTYVMFLRSVIN